MVETDFTNQQIDISLLPDIEDVEYLSLDKNAIKVGIIGSLLFGTIVSIIVLITSLFFNWISLHLFKILGGIGLLTVLSILYEYLSYKHKFYALREKDLLYKNGIIFRDLVAIPFNRVQHCEIDQGPIQRMYTLSGIKIFTAGGSNSDLVIEGLTKLEAERIKTYILGKTSMDEEE
jgi:membrane protein YdbS with pleckstrin-like domain